jgi:hypothetical protein
MPARVMWFRAASNTPAKPEYSSGVQASSELQTKPDWIELFLIQIKPTR